MTATGVRDTLRHDVISRLSASGSFTDKEVNRELQASLRSHFAQEPGDTQLFWERVSTGEVAAGTEATHMMDAAMSNKPTKVKPCQGLLSA